MIRAELDLPPCYRGALSPFALRKGVLSRSLPGNPSWAVAACPWGGLPGRLSPQTAWKTAPQLCFRIGTQRGRRRSQRSATKPGTLIAAASCLVILLASPLRAEEPQSFDGAKYLPLKVGRQMRYQVTVTPPVGQPRKATATNRTPERTDLGGKTYYKVTTTITGVPFIPDQLIYYRPAPEGVYQVLGGDEESPEWLYLPAKIKLGDEWGADTPSGKFRFAAVAVEDVVTPSGKYPKCLKLQVTMKKTLITNTQQQWLAAGIGVVKQSDTNAVFSSATVLDAITQEKEPQASR